MYHLMAMKSFTFPISDPCILTLLSLFLLSSYTCKSSSFWRSLPRVWGRCVGFWGFRLFFVSFFTVNFLLLLIYLLIVYFWLFGVMCSGVWPCTLCVLVSLIVAQTRSLHSFFHFVILYLTYGKILVKEAIASAQHYINSTLFGNPA